MLETTAAVPQLQFDTAAVWLCQRNVSAITGSQSLPDQSHLAQNSLQASTSLGKRQDNGLILLGLSLTLLRTACKHALVLARARPSFYSIDKQAQSSLLSCRDHALVLTLKQSLPSAHLRFFLSPLLLWHSSNHEHAHQQSFESLI